MPFKSRAQQRYLFSKAPGVAKEFAEKTPNIEKLPERVNPKGAVKNKPVTKAFKPGRKKGSQALASYAEDSRS